MAEGTCSRVPAWSLLRYGLKPEPSSESLDIGFERVIHAYRVVP
jgi:hypothetical protein